MASWKHGLAWPEKLNTGNEKIDGQHKTLFKLISDTIEAHTKNEQKDKLGEKLNFVANYTNEHFSYEEEIMREVSYPDYYIHKKFHDDFKITVETIKNDFETDGATDELVNILDKIVIMWVIQHIQREDVKIVHYIKTNSN